MNHLCHCRLKDERFDSVKCVAFSAHSQCGSVASNGNNIEYQAHLVQINTTRICRTIISDSVNTRAKRTRLWRWCMRLLTDANASKTRQ